MKHWHRCTRWTKKGFECPFRMREMEEEEQFDPELDVDETAASATHAERAQRAVEVSARATGGVGRQLPVGVAAEILADPVGAQVLQAISTQTAEPFEATGGSGQIGTVSTPVPLTKAVGKPVPALGGSGQKRHAPKIPVGVSPRGYEQKLVDLLVAATAPGPAEARPAIARKGAHTTSKPLVQGKVPPTTADGRRGLVEVIGSGENRNALLMTELALTAALSYGVIQSIKAFRNKNAAQFPKNPASRTGKVAPEFPTKPKGAPEFRKIPASTQAGQPRNDIPGTGTRGGRILSGMNTNIKGNPNVE